MKLPKNITDAIGKPRCACSVCGCMVEITGKGTFARHRRGFRSSCEGTARSVPEGAALEWVRVSASRLRANAERCRAQAQEELVAAEKREAMAAELEKVIVRETSK
jgi:hypothetical protein